MARAEGWQEHFVRHVGRARQLIGLGYCRRRARCHHLEQAGVSTEVMAACIANPEVLRPAALKSILDFEDEIWEKFHPEGTDQIGLLLP